MPDVLLNLVRGRRSRAELAVELLMPVLLIFAPLAYGATEAWSQQAVVVLAAAMAGVVGLDLAFRAAARPAWTWAYLPVGAFVLLAVLQTVPLPAGVVSLVSPATLSTRAELLGDAAGASAGPVAISFYPLATERDLRVLLAVVAVFAAVLHVYRRPEQVRGLLLAVAVAGVIAAGVAAWQNATGSRMVYGVRPAIHPFSGPFSNHSHFGQFANLSAGAAVGLGLALLAETFGSSGAASGGAGVRRRTGGPWGGSTAGRAGDLGLRDPRVKVAAALFAAAVFMAVTMALSLTRGGMVSLLAGGGLTGAAIALRRGRRSGGGGSGGGGSGGGVGSGLASVVAALGVVLVAALLAVGFDAVYGRLATLRDLDRAEAGRTDILRDAARGWAEFPVFGTGLGTFREVFPLYDTRPSLGEATHAENEYAQLMTETGIVGVALAAVFAGGVAVAWWRATGRAARRRSGEDREAWAVRWAAFGLGLGLVAILTHSASDFGQHVPANAVLTATFCALLINLSRGPSPAARPAGAGAAIGATPAEPASFRPGPRLAGGLAVAGVVVAAGAWAVGSAEADKLAEQASAAAALTGERIDRLEAAAATDLQNPDAGPTTDDLVALIGHAGRAAELVPADARHAYDLALARWRAISGDFDPDTGAPVPGSPTEGFARRIAADFEAVRRRLPTFAPAASMAGQIRLFALGDPSGAALIRKARLSAPASPSIAFTAGLLDLREGRPAEAYAAFAVARPLGGAAMNEAVDRLLAAGRPDLARDLAAGDRGLLLRVADALDAATADDSDHPLARIAGAARREAGGLLVADASGADARPEALVALADAKLAAGDAAGAVGLLRRALARDYGRVEWRLRLARALAAVGEPAEALREAKVCLRLRPRWPEAERLVGDLALLQGSERVTNASIAPGGSP